MSIDVDRRPRAGEVEERQAPPLEPDGKRIRGRIPYGTESRDLGGWREVIEPGALNRAKLDELVCVVDHAGVPIGRYPGTLELEDRDDGLHWSVSPPASRAEIREAIERGDLRAGSWRMVVGRDEWRGDVRHVHEISELRDVSVVTTGAYPPEAARVEMRSKDNSEAADEGREKENAMEDREVKMGDLETEDRSALVTHEPRAEGGLRVESRVVEPPGEGLIHEIAEFARDVRKGETRSLSTAITLSNPQYGTDLFDLLRPSSVSCARECERWRRTATA